jgi:transcriptional regulator with XRE-family HTH domain
MIVSNFEIGAAIRHRRQELALSQEDLALRLSVSHQQVQRYESGKNSLNTENLQLVASVLSVPVSYFFSRRTKAGMLETALGHENDGEGELLGHYRRIPLKEVKALVIDFARLAAQGRKVESL